MGRIGGIVFAMVLVATSALAQDWRGNGRLMGKVVDEAGKPIEGVSVRAYYPSVVGALEAKTNRRGEWSVDDVAEGSWKITFEKEGYHPAESSAEVDESGRSSALTTKLEKIFDPNAFIGEQVKKAEGFLGQRKFADARKLYEEVVAKVPDVAGPMQMYIARTYYEEKNPAKAIEHLEIGVQKDPANAQMKQMLVSVYLEIGNTEKATAVLSTIDEAAITDPAIYLNFGVALLKQQKAAEAVKSFDKAVQRFPNAPEGYYYRANANIELFNADKNPESPEKAKRLESIKADLQKFLQIAPNAPEAAQVKSLLEQLNK
ncbi:MAG: tetratricopeptide repeat protein [Vicinamibacterales bacterium]